MHDLAASSLHQKVTEMALTTFSFSAIQLNLDLLPLCLLGVSYAMNSVIRQYLLYQSATQAFNYQP